MNLADIPRISLAHLPTPLEPLPRLSEHLGGPTIYIKRDDQTGLALGGNKVRKLEFLVADALAQDCDTLVTTGGVQSNHARQTAAAAARLGLHCELFLPRIVSGRSEAYESQGNVLLDRLLGATIHLLPRESYESKTFDAAVARLRDEGRKPYFIPTGGSTTIGALGYVVATQELLAQAQQLGISPTHIVVATGSCGTHGGIVAGFALAGHGARIQGISVAGKADDRANVVRTRAQTRSISSAARSEPSPSASTSSTSTSAPATASRPKECWKRCDSWRSSKESCSIRSTPARQWPA